MTPCKCGSATYRPRRYIPKSYGSASRRSARRCEGCDLIVGRCTCRVSLIVHMCPPGDSGTMPCCGRTPFEAMQDRMTLNPKWVTCPGREAVERLAEAIA